MSTMSGLKIDGNIPNTVARVSLQGEWDGMGALIDDDVLVAFAVVGPADSVAAALRSRCAGAADRVRPIFYAASRDCITAVLKEFRQ
jgi:hypothetical protein